MDNVTHSLVGYALGRAWAGPQAASSRGRALILTSVLASNAPDLDFLTSLFGPDRQLVYLLEHRGFTHTLLLALVLGLAVAGACAAAYRLRERQALLQIALLSVVASFLHIGFDYLNDYGVHPFYPLDDRWFYGDSVFIVEPLLLAVLIPLPLWFGLRKLGRGIGASLALGLLLLVWGVSQVPWPTALGVTCLLAGSLALQRRRGARAGFALVASLLVVGSFATGARVARARVRAALHLRAPAERVLDIASSPLPGNPTCFRALVVSLDAAGTYRARVARSELLGPGLPDALRCRLLPSEPSAPLRPADLAAVGGVHFESVFAAPARELAALARDRCDAAAMLRFVRVPFWLEQAAPRASAGRPRSLLGDLRYDRAPEAEFAERWLTGTCPDAHAPWLPPRAELLRP